MTTTDDLLTPEQVAEYLRVNRGTVYRFIRDGRLAASRVGRVYRIPRRSVELLLWATRARDDIPLRNYTRDQIVGFIESDRLDEAAQAVVSRFEQVEGAAKGG